MAEETTLHPEPAQPDSVVEAIADGVAEAINSVSVAYSHQTSNKMQTMNHMWSVHDSCEGNPFDRDEWLGQFDNKEDANELAMKIRRERSIASVRKTLAALSPPRDDVRGLLRLDTPCRLDEAPIGLFLCCGELCLKTEYREPNGAVSAFIVSSGEFFWGPSPQTVANQNACTVTPCRIDATLSDTPSGESESSTRHEGSGTGSAI